MGAMEKPNSHMQAILDVLEELNPLPIETLTPEQARVMPLPDRAAFIYYGQHITKRALAPMPPPIGRVEHALIPGGDNGIPVRIYAPKKEAPEAGWPVVVYFHGGGWVIATLDTYDGSCRALSNGAECMVISVEYRKAPEHPFPAAVEDAFNAYKWVLTNAASIGGDSGRVAVAGESAGGNLAAVVAQLARDQGVPAPVHQLLVYPVTDIAHGPSSPSAVENATAKPLNKAMLDWFYSYYVPEGTDRIQPALSPYYAADLTGLPSATVINAQIDPLRDDGEKYAKKLAAANVPVIHKVYDGVTHEFFGLAGLVSEATEAVALACKSLRKAFNNE
jgi:acetyl esterase